MRAIDVTLAALFVIAALLQGNDPDPAYWVLVYGGTGVVALAAALNRRSEFWTVLLLGAAAAGMLIALPGLLDYFTAGDFGSLTGPMLAEKPWVEPAREFLGLALCAAALVWYRRRARTKGSAKRHHNA